MRTKISAGLAFGNCFGLIALDDARIKLKHLYPTF
jgi:hypothetical protein